VGYDPDPDLDRHQNGKSDPDRHQNDADIKHCLEHYIPSQLGKKSLSIKLELLWFEKIKDPDLRKL
jgi:hypothetical protein